MSGGLEHRHGKETTMRRLGWSLAITAVVMVVESTLQVGIVTPGLPADIG